MRKIFILFFKVLLFINCLHAQDKETIIVKAGTSFLDYFTIAERYHYPDFQNGIILFKMESYAVRKLNYNYLIGEMEFLENSDTLTIRNSKDIKEVIIAQDTFYCDDGYILQIKSTYPKVGLREFIEFKSIIKKDTYGIASSGSSTLTLNALPSEGNYYKLKANQDMVYERTKQYYISTFSNAFVLFTKRNVFKLFSRNREEIKSYLKTNKVKFESGDELLKLADYLGSL